MREIVLGTAGHVDHGKTSLVRALSGIETDRLKEEKKRGITIELGFAFLDLPCGHRLGIVDVPGHEKFVKNMVAGAAGVDLIAFVIAADEGIMPQTREHFEICSLLGVKRGLIVITKTDMVEEEWLEMVQEEVRDFFVGSFLEQAPMVCVSSVTNDGIDQAINEIDKLVSNSDFNEAHGPFRLPVDRIFSMKGFGAVVTGTSISGRINLGEDVIIYPSGREAKIRGIQVHGSDVDQVEAGHRTAINIQGLEKEFVERGDVLASSNSLESTYMLDCDFTYLSSNLKSLKNRTRVRVHIGTAEIMGRVVLLDVEEAAPGDTINVQILLEEPIAVWPGDHYVVRCYSPVYTIGGGVIFNSKPGRKRRRFKQVNADIFSLYRNGKTDDTALFHLKESAFNGMTFRQLEVRLGIFGKRLKKILSQPISARKILIVDSDRQLMISAEVFEKLKHQASTIIDTYHQHNPLKEGIGKEELRSQLAFDIETKLFNLIITSLIKDGLIVQEQAYLRLTSHQVSLKDDVGKLRKLLEEKFAESGLKPPTRKELVGLFADFSSKLIGEVLDILLREKAIVKVSEDLYFNAEQIDQLQNKLVAKLQKEGEIGAPDFKAMTGVSRKFFIPLMEFFDKQKITIRVGDKRILREKRS